jgi:hypothetical protein
MRRQPVSFMAGTQEEGKMSQPISYAKASLLISEKANQLGHNAKGNQGRWWANSFLGLSALLGAVAGSTGLADLVSKTWVSIIALAATASTTVAISLLTTLKYDAHLRAQGKYAALFHQTVRCDINTPDGVVHFDLLWKNFGDVVGEVDGERVSLNNSQTRKFERKARNELGDEEMQKIARILPMPLPPLESLPPPELPPLQVGI